MGTPHQHTQKQQFAADQRGRAQDEWDAHKRCEQLCHELDAYMTDEEWSVWVDANVSFTESWAETERKIRAELEKRRGAPQPA